MLIANWEVKPLFTCKILSESIVKYITWYFSDENQTHFQFTGLNEILEFIYIYIHVYLNKNWKKCWSEQIITGLGPELIVRTDDPWQQLINVCSWLGWLWWPCFTMFIRSKDFDKMGLYENELGTQTAEFCSYFNLLGNISWSHMIFKMVHVDI